MCERDNKLADTYSFAAKQVIQMRLCTKFHFTIRENKLKC